MRDDWTHPGAEEVAPGVYRIPLPLPTDHLKAVNVYAIPDGDGLVLVDSGWAVPEARAELASGLARLECSLADIRRFLVTHAHRDHYTQAVTLRREFLTRVSLGIGEQPSLELLLDPGRVPLAGRLRQLRSYGASALADDFEADIRSRQATGREDWELPDEWLVEGMRIPTAGGELTVIETPGHTNGHVVFHDPSAALLFAGDHVLPHITPSIGFEPSLSNSPLAAFLASLARVRELPDALLLPAHGPVGPSVHARVDELIDHHGRRLDQTETAVAAGAETAFEVAGCLRWTRRERTLEELDLFNQMLAVAETGAHLVLLVAQGRLSRALDGEVLHFHMPG